jgi:hypothetical protein
LLEFANAEKARYEASMENLTKDYAKALDQNLQLNEQLRRYKEVLYRGPIGLSTKTRISMIDEANQTEITQLKAKLELCRESLIECRVCSMMPGEVEKITTEALASIERRDGE